MRKTKEELEQDLNERSEELDAQNEELKAAIDHVVEKNERLNELIEELAQRNKELDEIIYRSHHDLKGPVASILGLCNLIKMEAPEQESTVFQVENMAARMERIVKNLLQYSGNLKNEVTPEVIDLEKLIKDVLRDLSYLDPEKKIDINQKITQEEPFRSDYFRLEIILSQIIMNAFVFQKPVDRSQIDIKISSNKASCTIEVTDDGIGMDENTLREAERFFHRGSHLSKGGGLGLYLTRMAVKRLQGSMNIQSEEDRGTKVLVTLPNLRSVV